MYLNSGHFVWAGQVSHREPLKPPAQAIAAFGMRYSTGKENSKKEFSVLSEDALGVPPELGTESLSHGRGCLQNRALGGFHQRTQLGGGDP